MITKCQFGGLAFDAVSSPLSAHRVLLQVSRADYSILMAAKGEYGVLVTGSVTYENAFMSDTRDNLNGCAVEFHGRPIL